LPVLLAFRFGVIAATLALSGRSTAARWVAFIGSAAASTATGLLAANVLRTETGVEGVLLAHRASGLTLGYEVDALAAWFLVVLALLAVPVAIYSLGYVAHPHLSRRSAYIGVMFNVLLGAVELVFVAGDAITFLGGWEMMTLATAALVITDHHERSSRLAAYLYLVMSHLGTGCLIAGFLILASASGTTAFSTILAGTSPAGPWQHVLFLLFFAGFGVKAGIVPLHVWLPEAHPAAPTSISALMSGVLIKTGIFGIVKVCAFGLGTPLLPWGVLIVIVGGVSALLGVLYALMQHDLKRLLAYHSIENIGIILLGLGAGMIGLSYGRTDVAALGVSASLYHVLNHAVFKGLLFLGAGGVVMATATRQIEHLGGLLRRMPWTGLFFLIGAMAISGLPPLNGFASEWLTFQAFLFGFRGSAAPLTHLLFPLGGALLALTTALAAACFVKAFGITFLAQPRSREADAACESPAVMLVPQACLAAMCLALGAFPGFVLSTLAPVIRSLPGFAAAPDVAPGNLAMVSGLESFDRVVPVLFGVALLAAGAAAMFLTRRRGVAARRVPTWGCGGELSAGSEYTATAFSKPLMMIFSALYRPNRQVEALTESSPYFPREVRYRSEIEPTFERLLYEPLVRAVLRLAGGLKVLQAGSLHAYLGYVIAMVVTLVLWVWWTS